MSIKRIKQTYVHRAWIIWAIAAYLTALVIGIGFDFCESGTKKLYTSPTTTTQILGPPPGTLFF